MTARADVSEQAFLTALLERPMSPPDPDVVAKLKAGPMDPSNAVALGEIDRLLDPSPLKADNGWCTMPDDTVYVAVRTAMPKVTAEMVDWWFDWHPRESLRYNVWHPKAHIGNSVDLPATLGAKAHWWTVHYPVEDVGTGEVHARISFKPPTQMGFSTDALDDPNVATVVTGLVADEDLHVSHSVMAHVWLNEGEGTVLRSHFWLGPLMRPDLPGALGDLAGKLINRPFFRRRALPKGIAEGLSLHCTEEYTHLAEILPELYAQFSTE
jgi:hypothetical protein